MSLDSKREGGRVKLVRYFRPFFAFFLMPALAPCTAGAATLDVPGDYSDIQSALDGANDGDVVRVAPGTWDVDLTFGGGKSVTLASHFIDSGDEGFIASTILDGFARTQVVTVHSSAGPDTAIIGFTIRNASDGIHASGKFGLHNSLVRDTGDGIDYENGGGGLVTDCIFEDNADDGLDFDGSSAATIERTVIRNNGDDGIEVRLHNWTGSLLEIVIRDSEITGNGEDGIQLIDDTALSNREFTFERNIIANNADAGIGMMCCQDTTEDLSGAPIAERVNVFDNTIVGNTAGITGGVNVVALNNIIANNTAHGLFNVTTAGDGSTTSIAAYNLLFGNTPDVETSNIDGESTVFADPLLDAAFELLPSSPAIDAGTASFTWDSELVLDRLPNEYSGDAPDCGARESVAASVSSMPGWALAVTALIVTLIPPAFFAPRRRARPGAQGTLRAH